MRTEDRDKIEELVNRLPFALLAEAKAEAIRRIGESQPESPESFTLVLALNDINGRLRAGR